MTKEQLQQYRSLILEIEILQKRIDKINGKEVQHDFVKGSNSEFPYEPKSFHVSGYNIMTYSKKQITMDKIKADRLQVMLKKKQDECQEELLRIQGYINGIPDSTDRIIFTMAFINGVILEDIGKKLHMDRSNVGKRINKYLGE